MKNKMTRNVILMAVVTVIMAVALSLYIQNTGTVPAADNAASLTDGIYTSSAQGYLSDVTVRHRHRHRRPGDRCGDRCIRRDSRTGRHRCRSSGSCIAQDRFYRWRGCCFRFHYDQSGHLYRHGRLPASGSVSGKAPASRINPRHRKGPCASCAEAFFLFFNALPRFLIAY